MPHLHSLLHRGRLSARHMPRLPRHPPSRDRHPKACGSPTEPTAPTSPPSFPHRVTCPLPLTRSTRLQSITSSLKPPACPTQDWPVPQGPAQLPAPNPLSSLAYRLRASGLPMRSGWSLSSLPLPQGAPGLGGGSGENPRSLGAPHAGGWNQQCSARRARHLHKELPRQKHRELVSGREAASASRPGCVPSSHQQGEEIVLEMQRGPGTRRSPGGQESPARPCRGPQLQAPDS